MSYFWFELRYLVCAPFTFILLAQFPTAVRLHNRHKRSRKWSLPWWITGLLLLPFGIQDVLYNWTCGSLFFLERPREWLFTTRLKRLDDAGEMPGFIRRFKMTLNEIDLGHV